MNKRLHLLVSMMTKGLCGFLMLGLLLFGCAGSLQYINAWMLLASLFVLMSTMGTFLLIKYPETLEKRLQAKEQETAQKGYISIIGILFVVSFALSGLNYRFQWTEMPLAISAFALITVFIGYGLFGAVMLQNSYASRTVEVQKDQVVVSTGLYAVVRHPMYFACLILFLPMPLVLGSYFALLPMLAFPIGLILRIKNEEAILITGLKGYSEYMQKTKYRLIPYIW